MPGGNSFSSSMNGANDAGTKRTDADFARQMNGYGMLTAEIHYYRPDHPHLLQLFVWQCLDIAPAFPELGKFLDHWRREIEATLHSIRIAHSRLIRPAEWRMVDGEFRIH